MSLSPSLPVRKLLLGTHHRSTHPGLVALIYLSWCSGGQTPLQKQVKVLLNSVHILDKM